MQLPGWMVMQVYGYAARRRIGIGHVALWFLTVHHLAEALLFSHPMPAGIRYRFHGSFYTLCH